MASEPATGHTPDGANAATEIERLQRALEACQAERASLAASEMRHRRLVENMTGGYFFYSHDTERNYQYVSSSVTQVLGYTTDEYVARSAELFTDAAINEAAREHTARAVAGEAQYSFEAEVWAKDGGRRTLEVSEVPVLDAAGRVELIEGIAHDVTEKKALENRLIELATQDELTGLLNRRHLRVRLLQTLSLSNRHGFDVVMAMLDLDGLKACNDTHGHAAGDRVIVAAARILESELRRSDIVGRSQSLAGRLGGDEFAAVLLTDGSEGALVAMRRVLAAFAAAEVELPDGAKVALRASIGMAQWRRGESAEELQARADAALYRAKREARGQIVVWSKPAD